MSSSSARSLRLLHTADWHLGHTLKGHDRAAEHDVFLRWLVATIAERAIDVVVIAGDVFDQANPSARAQAQLYEFFAAVHRLGRDVDVAAKPVDRGEELVQLRLRARRRVRLIEHVAGDHDDVDGALGDGRHQPAQEHVVFGGAVMALERVAKVPVRGVQQAQRSGGRR